MSDEQSISLLEITVIVVSEHLSNNSVSTGDVPKLIQTVHAAFAGLGQNPGSEIKPDKPKGAVSVRKSLADPNRLISMIDGKPYAALKRHITGHGYTPETYRETFGLPKDYPLVSTGYSQQRREMAKSLGLGRKKDAAVAVKRGKKPAVKVGATERAKAHLAGE